MTKKAPKPVVERTMTFDPPNRHQLKELIESDDLDEVPELVSVGMYKVGGNWVSFVMESKGSQVTKITLDEPNLRPIAEESAKINFVNKFMTNE